MNKYELENILLQTLTHNKWISTKEILDAVSQKYSVNIKPQSVMRSLRKLRETNEYFIFTKRTYNGTSYKLCSTNDVSNAHPFFDVKKEDIIASHKLKKTGD
jgi:hypothetical protein